MHLLTYLLTYTHTHTHTQICRYMQPYICRQWAATGTFTHRQTDTDIQIYRYRHTKATCHLVITRNPQQAVQKMHMLTISCLGG